MPYKFSRRQTQPYVRNGRLVKTIPRHSAASKIQSWFRRRKKSFRPMATKRFGRAQNSNRYVTKVRGKYLTDNPTPMSRATAHVTRGLSNAGVIEKRLIQHVRQDYVRNAKIFTNNPKLDLMSGAYIKYGFPDITAQDGSANLGIQMGEAVDAFTIAAAGGSADRYAFYKNFQTEITINTSAISLTNGVSSPVLTSQQVLAMSQPLNFRVILLQKKPDARNNNYSATPTGVNEVLWSNALLMGYDESPYGPVSVYASPTGGSNIATQQDMLWGKLNFKHFRVLEDRKFSLSVPQSSWNAAAAGISGAGVRSDQKLPSMKKLVFSHPINQKTLVHATGAAAVRPIDMNTQFFALILCGQPNSPILTVAPSNPSTVGLWAHSIRGFTSYLDA